MPRTWPGSRACSTGSRPTPQLVAGGKRLPRPGWFLPATVVAGVEQDDEIVQSEIFGPVVTVQVFGDEDEALTLANGVDHGLTASVWTDRPRAARCGSCATSTSARSR